MSQLDIILVSNIGTYGNSNQLTTYKSNAVFFLFVFFCFLATLAVAANRLKNSLKKNRICFNSHDERTSEFFLLCFANLENDDRKPVDRSPGHRTNDYDHVAIFCPRKSFCFSCSFISSNISSTEKFPCCDNCLFPLRCIASSH